MEILTNIALSADGAGLNVVLDENSIGIMVSMEISPETDFAPMDSAWMETNFGAENIAEAKRVCQFLRNILSEKGLTFLKNLQKTNADLIDLLNMYHAKDATAEDKDLIYPNALKKALCLRNMTPFDWD